MDEDVQAQAKLDAVLVTVVDSKRIWQHWDSSEAQNNRLCRCDFTQQN